MSYPNFFDPKNSLQLFGLNKYFDFISKLYIKKNLPKVLMFTGNKGFGKSTLINHFLFSIFDENNYERGVFKISKNSNFFREFKNNIHPNIIYINSADFKSVKIEDIRNLKSTILQSTISNQDRFIIFDDIELFNKNSLNALLKIIEEPTKKNYFFLINNKSKPLIKTIESRALEIKIILNESQRVQIINDLLSVFNLEPFLNVETSHLSPGNFVKFNYLCQEFNISPMENFINNLSLLLNLYKKNKDILFINLVYFIADNYLKHLKEKKYFKNEKIFEIRNFILDKLNSYMLFNLDQNSLINAVNDKLNYE